MCTNNFGLNCPHKDVPFQASKKQCHHSKLSESLCLINLSWWDRCCTLAASQNMHPRNTQPGWTTLHTWLSSRMTDWSPLSVQHFLALQCWIVCFTHFSLYCGRFSSWSTEPISIPSIVKHADLPASISHDTVMTVSVIQSSAYNSLPTRNSIIFLSSSHSTFKSLNKSLSFSTGCWRIRWRSDMFNTICSHTRLKFRWCKLWRPLSLTNCNSSGNPYAVNRLCKTSKVFSVVVDFIGITSNHFEWASTIYYHEHRPKTWSRKSTCILIQSLSGHDHGCNIAVGGLFCTLWTLIPIVQCFYRLTATRHEFRLGISFSLSLLFCFDPLQSTQLFLENLTVLLYQWTESCTDLFEVSPVQLNGWQPVSTP